VTPAQFLGRVKKNAVPPAALLLGPEAYERRRIKEALTGAFAPDAITQHDLAEISVLEVVDDARSLSLFASERLIWV
jgi:DNA polymerase-3 subunit delta